MNLENLTNKKLPITLDEIKKQDNLVKKVLTLCLIVKDGKILLGMKKRGFGSGKWNGFGGKLKEGESISEAAKREVKEESGLEVKNIEERGVINFYFQQENNNIHNVHIFICNDFKGEVKETEEMKPEWFDVNNLPTDKMWPADITWLPIFLQNKKFSGEILFDKPTNEEYTSKVLDGGIKKI